MRNPRGPVNLKLLASSRTGLLQNRLLGGVGLPRPRARTAGGIEIQALEIDVATKESIPQQEGRIEVKKEQGCEFPVASQSRSPDDAVF